VRLFVALAAAAPLFAQTCTYNVSPTQFSIGAGDLAGSITGTVNVTAQDGCAWSAVSKATWLHVNVGQNGTGNGTVGWSADRSPLPVARQGIITVANQPVTITQAAAVCSYALSPTSAQAPVTGASGSFAIKTNCFWTAVTNNKEWITVPQDATGIVDGTVNYTVAANGCVAGRSGSIAVQTGSGNPPTFPITQDGSPNNLTISATSATVGPAATDGTVNVSTGVGCNWSVYSDVSWLQITASAGAGNGHFSYHVPANTGAARTGNIHVNGTSLLFTVTQQAPPPPPVQLNAIVSSATNASGAVSPGEIVVLYGSNIGPASLATAQLTPDGRSLTKSLAGTRVLFDGTPAAMIYTKAQQVSAVVPYAVAGKSTTQVQVEYQGVLSSAMPAPVQAATPGIFTLDFSGIGPGAILNQDYSVNARASAAAAGSVVMIYCTGGGVTDPPSVDAALAPTAEQFPRLKLPVSVTIGGIAAAVPYAGGAPGSVAGLTQINAQIPPGVTPGPSVAVVVRVGNWQSQNGVTLAVK
jgi:uncharacterized protein (TIGR03437 family)